MTEEPRVQISSIYTDGSHCPETRTGGWGVIVCYDDGSILEFGGSVPNTRIIRMELYAALNALKFLSESENSVPVTIYIDCDSLLVGVTRLLPIWKSNDWRNRKGREIHNRDLWQMIDQLNSNMVLWERIPAHRGNNKICDAIARMFALRRIGLPKIENKTFRRVYENR